MATINRLTRLLSRMQYCSLAPQKTFNQWGVAGVDREQWNHLFKKEEPEVRNVRWIFLGCPGVGKGTYASRLSKLLGIPHIATGDLVREELTESGPSANELESIVNQGKLVPDDIILKLLARRLEKSALKGETGFILDGFPRTINQAVQTTMIIEEDKLRRFLKDGQATFFVHELKYGYQWRRTMDNLWLFEHTCWKLNQAIKRSHDARKEEIFMLSQIQEWKSIVWMEGPLGWTAWVDLYYDILH